MNSPFCWGEVRCCDYQDMFGHWQYEAVASPPESCVHGAPHWYQDFDRAVQRIRSDLRLGFDLRRGFFVVFKLTPSPLTITPGINGLRLQCIYHFIDHVIDCKQARLVDHRGGLRTEVVPRTPGDWVLRELRGSDQERFDPKGNWGMKQAAKITEKQESEMRKGFEDHMTDLMEDHFSIADPGDPLHSRIMERVPEKTWEPCQT